MTLAQWTGLIFLQCWLFLVLRGWALLLDPGTFWHLVVGDRIVRAGLPREDWLSFTHAGAHWIPQQWLAEVAMSFLYRVGGFDALVVAFSGAVALLLTFLFHRLVVAGVRPGWAVIMMVLAALASQHQLHARPLILSWVLFAWLYAELVGFEAGRIGAWRLLALLPVFAVWTNLHGAALGGVATLVLTVCGWAVSRLLRRPSPLGDRRSAAAAAALTGGSCAMVLVNPFGLELPRAWLAIMGSPHMPRLMDEHKSFVASPAWLAAGMIAAFVAACFAARWQDVRVTSLLALVWLALGLQRARHLPFFAIAAVLSLPDLVAHVRSPLPLPDWLRFTRRAGDPPLRGGALRWPVAIVLAAVLGTAALHDHPVARDARPRLVSLLEKRWPVRILPEIRAAAASLPDGSAVLNDMLLGGFMSFHAPNLRIFIDDRWELYGDAFVLEYVESKPASYEVWVARYDPALALTTPRSRLDEHVAGDARWQRIAGDETATLYRRRSTHATRVRDE